MNRFSIASAADVDAIGRGGYERFMAFRHVHAALEATARTFGDRVALTSVDVPDPAAPVRRWTYAQFLGEVRRAANLFTALARQSGVEVPRVALLLPPIPEAHFALWGAETAGVACPLNFQLDAGVLAELVNACRANILVALGPVPDLDVWSRAERVAAACPGVRHVLMVRGDDTAVACDASVLDFVTELARQDSDRLSVAPADDPHALAALFHTGGTTGAPKLARHTHRNQLHSAWGAAQMFGCTERDVMLNGFPLFHVAGSFVYGLSTLLAGGEIVLPTRTGMRNPGVMSNYGAFVERRGVTLLAAVPTLMAALLTLELKPSQLARVRALLTGGSPLPDELAAAFEQRHGIPVRNILGMTESAGVISIEPLAGPRTPGSCGLPLPFTTVRAVRADGTEAAPGEPGILRVRGPNVSPGYTDARRDAGTFDDGWLVSGDIGHVDADGRVFVTGRAKDVIIRGAHNIDPGMIESALLRHPDVQMAAAVGAPDAYAGELPVAFVSLKPGARTAVADIAAFATPHIAERPAVPKRVDIVPTMPTTAVGKVYKPALRVFATQRVLDEQLAAAGLAPRARVRVAEAPSGIVAAFEIDDPADESKVRELMKPYAIAWEVRRRETR